MYIQLQEDFTYRNLLFMAAVVRFRSGGITGILGFNGGGEVTPLVSSSSGVCELCARLRSDNRVSLRRP